jgi:hypothetical protein
MDREFAYAEGRKEFQKGAFISLMSSLVFYYLNELPFLSFKFLLFIPFEFIVGGVILSPAYLAISSYRSRVKEDTFNKTMALLFLPLIGFSIFVGFIVVWLFKAIAF